jgi:hypothetical protein
MRRGAEAIDHQAGGYLYADVGVEIERRQIAQRRRADGELGHQLLGDDCRRDTLKERQEVQRGSHAPDQECDRQRRPATVRRHHAV